MRLILAVSIVCAAALALSTFACGGSPSVDVQITVPFAPQLVRSRLRRNLAYEINLAPDYRSQGFTLTRVEVLDAASENVLAVYEGKTLADNMMFPDTYKDISIPIVLIWLKLDHSQTPPVSLTHRLQFTRSGDKRIVTIKGANTTINTSPARVIAAPFKSDMAGAFETTDGSVHHFRLPIMFKGLTRNPQRFGGDWLVLTPDGKPGTRDGAKNEDYPGWGVDLLAVADGAVVDVENALDDFEGSTGDLTKVPATRVTGNHVYLDIGGGLYAIYAHCLKGSVVVNKGDKVVKGQVIAKMGNSGMSMGPHLHFQLSNGPDPLVAESVPYVLDKFTLVGNAAEVFKSPDGKYTPCIPTRVTDRIPDIGDVMRMGE
jgi:murein DD-endopeptidase